MGIEYRTPAKADINSQTAQPGNDMGMNFPRIGSVNSAHFDSQFLDARRQGIRYNQCYKKGYEIYKHNTRLLSKGFSTQPVSSSGGASVPEYGHRGQ